MMFGGPTPKREPAVVVLDHIDGITLDTTNPPVANYQALNASRVGLKSLADRVRDYERAYIASDPVFAEFVTGWTLSSPPLVQCAFNWFSVELVNYLRLVGLIQLMNQQRWKSSALVDTANQAVINLHCKAYAKRIAPGPHKWRDKVAGHFAATAPYKEDNLGTLELSLMNLISYKYPHYLMGGVQFVSSGQRSDLPTWGVTQVYEGLGPRLWPDSKLKPFRDAPAPADQAPPPASTA